MTEPGRVRRAAVVVGLSLIGAASLTAATRPGRGIDELGTAWSSMLPSEQSAICDTLDAFGETAAAHLILQVRRVAASVDDAERFVKGLACDIRIQVDTG